MPGLERCSRCGAVLDGSGRPLEPEPTYPIRRGRWRRRSLTPEDRRALGLRLRWFQEGRSPGGEPSLVAAVFLSLLPGLGHWYLKAGRRGLQAAAGMAGVLLLCLISYRWQIARLHPMVLGAAWGLVATDALVQGMDRQGRQVTHWMQRIGAGLLGGAVGILFLMLLTTGIGAVLELASGLASAWRRDLLGQMDDGGRDGRDGIRHRRLV